MIEQIRTDVHDLSITNYNGGRYRVFLFDGAVPTLVDAGFEDTTDAVAERLAELGVVPERLVVTHGDPDHIGGLAGLAERYNLETWVPEQTNVGDEYVPDNRYGHGDEIGQFVAIHTPGHALDHHALVDEQGEIAVLGDALFGADARGLPEGHFVLPPEFFSENLAEADEILERLLDYEFDVGLVFHGSNVTSDASEKIERFVDFTGKPD